ncbi:hypothetical protein Emag_003392 [Eimeria magna]
MELPSNENESYALSMTLQGERRSAKVQLTDSFGGKARSYNNFFRVQRVRQLKAYHLAASAALSCVLAVVSLVLICYRMSLGAVDPGDVNRALASGLGDQDDESDQVASAFLESCLQVSDQLTYEELPQLSLELSYEATSTSVSSMQQAAMALESSALDTAEGASAPYNQPPQFPFVQHGHVPLALFLPEISSARGSQAPEHIKSAPLSLQKLPYVPSHESATHIGGSLSHWEEGAPASAGSTQGFQHFGPHSDATTASPTAEYAGGSGWTLGPLPSAQAPQLYTQQEARSALSGEAATSGFSGGTPSEWFFGGLASGAVTQFGVPETVYNVLPEQPGFSEAALEQREEQTGKSQPRLPLKRRARKQPTGKKEKPQKRGSASRKPKAARGKKGSPDSSEAPQAHQPHTELASLLLDLEPEPSLGADDAREPGSAGGPDGSSMPWTPAEAGREAIEKQEDPLAKSGSTEGCVTVRLRSGSICRIPHPSPPMPPSTHLYYRLPRVATSAIRHLFHWQPGMIAGPRSRKFRKHFHNCASLLAKEELDSEGIDQLMEALKNVLRHMMRTHTDEVRSLSPYKAVEILAVRYLGFEMLVSSIHLFGPAMLPQEWFPVLVESVPTKYNFDIPLQSPEAKAFIMLSVKLSSHLDLLKHGVRPNMESTIQLKKELFQRAAHRQILEGEIWDLLRQSGDDI